jgi:hypothetical protein
MLGLSSLSIISAFPVELPTPQSAALVLDNDRPQPCAVGKALVPSAHLYQEQSAD